MATVLEEFLTKLGFDIDDKDLNEFNRKIDDARKNMGNFAMMAAGVMSAALAGLGVAALNASDNVTGLKNRLRELTDTEDDVIRYKDVIFQLANETRAGWEATGQFFTRYGNVLKAQGKDLSEAEGFVRTFNQALGMAGLTGAETSSVLLQFSQALNKGKLDGDEFRTVMEAMPFIARLIEKEMGAATGAIYDLSESGAITLEVLQNALLNASDDIDGAFRRSVLRADAGWQIFINDVVWGTDKLLNMMNVGQDIAQLFVSMGAAIRNVFSDENIDQMNRAYNAIRAIIKPFADFLATVIPLEAALTAAALVIGGIFVGALMAATQAMVTFTIAALTNPFVWLAIGAAALGAAIVLLVDDWMTFKRGGESAIGSLMERFPIFAAFVQYVTRVVKIFGDTFSQIFSIARDRINTLAATFGGDSEFMTNIRALWTALEPLAMWFLENLPNAIAFGAKAFVLAFSVITGVILGVIQIFTALVNLIMKAVSWIGKMSDKVRPIMGLFNGQTYTALAAQNMGPSPMATAAASQSNRTNNLTQSNNFTISSPNPTTSAKMVGREIDTLNRNNFSPVY